jgi:hypothetical protein
MKNSPVFGDRDLLVKVFIADCGGHGRALELLAENIEDIRKNPHAVQSFINQLARRHQVAIPDQETAITAVRAVMANHTLKRDEIIPGGKKTPDEISQSSLLYFRLHSKMLTYPIFGSYAYAQSIQTTIFSRNCNSLTILRSIPFGIERSPFTPFRMGQALCHCDGLDLV